MVDDDAETRRLLSDRLSALAFRVNTTGSCARAIEAAEQQTYDVIVLDVMLPDGCGIELCTRLRASAIATPVLLLSAPRCAIA